MGLKHTTEFWQLYTLICMYADNPIKIQDTFIMPQHFMWFPFQANGTPTQRRQPLLWSLSLALNFLPTKLWERIFLVWLRPSRCEIHVWDGLSLHAMGTKVPSSLLPTKSSLYECSTIYFSIVLLKVIWGFPSLGVLWIRLPWTFLYKSFCGFMFSLLLGKNLGVQSIVVGKYRLSFVRNLQAIIRRSRTHCSLPRSMCERLCPFTNFQNFLHLNRL